MENAGQFGPDKGYSLTVLEHAATPTPTRTATPTLHPTATPTSTAPPGCQDAHEPDDIVPRMAGVGEARVHSLCPAGDEDRVVFTARPGQAYRIETLHRPRARYGTDYAADKALTNDDRAPQTSLRSGGTQHVDAEVQSLWP